MSDCILTISIAAYNVEKYLKETLDSLVCLHNKNVEVLVVNDGSTDKTLDIATEYQMMYPSLFKVINKSNAGWGSTLNVSFKLAKGKYFKQLDGDDLYDANNLMRFVDYLKIVNDDLIISPYSVFTDSNPNKTKIVDFEQLRKLSHKTNFLEKAINCYPYMQMHSACLKTKLITDNDISLSENCFYTDVEFMVKCILNANTFSFFDGVVYKYRIGRQGQSVSIQGMRKHYKEHQKVLFVLVDLFSKIHEHSNVNTVVMNRISLMARAHYDYLLFLDDSSRAKSELKKFDSLLKEHSAIYQISSNLKINLLRNCNFNYVFIIRFLSLTLNEIKSKIFNFFK